jgi:hypothetical protein
MIKQLFTAEDLQKMVDTTKDANGWNYGQFAKHAHVTLPELSRFMNTDNPTTAPSKIVSAFNLKKLTIVRYENE